LKPPHHRIATLLTALACLSVSAHAAPKSVEQDAFLDQPIVQRGLNLLQYRGRVPADTLKAPCRQAVKPENKDADANIAACLDAAVKFIDPQASFSLHDRFGSPKSGSAGIGVMLKDANGMDGFMVSDVIPKTPAAAGGIEAGDKLIEIDGRPVAGWAFSEVLDNLRGKPGSSVQLTLQRATQAPLKVSLQRASFQLEPLYGAPLKAGWYMQVRDFPDGLVHRARSSLQAALQADALKQALVIDLRGNRGGPVSEIGALVALLAPEVQPVMYQVAPHGFDRVIDSMDPGDATDDEEIGPRLKELPFILLVDRGTTGGAEWLVEVLRQRRGTWVLGERTEGLAKISAAYQLDDYGWFKVPSGVLFPGRGMPIDGYGIDPDEARPVEPYRLGKPPEWLAEWLTAGTHRRRPPARPAPPVANNAAADKVCLGDVKLVQPWPGDPASIESRGMTVRFHGAAGEFTVSQEDLPSPAKLDALWAQLRERTDKARESTTRNIALLTEELGQSKQRAGELRKDIEMLQRRLKDIGLHRLEGSEAQLLVMQEDDLVVWVRGQWLYKLQESRRAGAALSERVSTYADLLDRLARQGPATGARSELCLLDGSLALKDRERPTSWLFHGIWKAADEPVLFSMESRVTHSDKLDVSNRAANFEQSSSSDVSLLKNEVTDLCPSYDGASVRQIIEAASIAGEPAVLRGLRIDKTRGNAETVSCRAMTVINRVPLDESVHWHRTVRLFTRSRDAARADARLAQWRLDFNAVPTRQGLTGSDGRALPSPGRC